MTSGISAVELHIILGCALFALGALGLMFKRSGVVVLMCLELLLNGVNVILVAFNSLHGGAAGYSLTLFMILVAAAEAGVGLSLLVTIYRSRGLTLMDHFKELKA